MSNDGMAAGGDMVVVGVDFSEHSTAAVKRAKPIVADGAMVMLLHIDHSRRYPMPADLTPEWDPELQRKLEELRDLHLGGEYPLGQIVCRVLNHHHASEGLCAAAHSANAKLIIVGSQGRTGLDRWVLGSVAEATVRHARCDVLVVKQASEAK